MSASAAETTGAGLQEKEPIFPGYLDPDDHARLAKTQAVTPRKRVLLKTHASAPEKKPVWKSFLLLPQDMRPRYCRTPGHPAGEPIFDDKYACTHACLHCRQLLIIGNTKWLKAEPGVKATHPRIPNPKGCWQTTRAVGHLQICPEVTEKKRDEGIREVIEARKEAKLERMKSVAHKPMALSNSAGGIVFGAGNLQRDMQQEARHAIARCPLNCSHPLPDSFVEDKHLREMLDAGTMIQFFYIAYFILCILCIKRYTICSTHPSLSLSLSLFPSVFEAGRDVGIRGDSKATCPRITIKALEKHATAEFDVLQASLLHYHNALHTKCLGNPSTFCMSDIVTLACGKPYQSIGVFSTCPKTCLPMHTCCGFANVPDKKDPTTADDMHAQSLRFSGHGQTTMSHTIVADRAATPGVGNQLDERHPPPCGHLPCMTKVPCGLHDHSKPVQFVTNGYGYKKDGEDLWDMPDLNGFTDDVAEYEREMRAKDIHLDLCVAAASVPGGSSAMKLRSNFNTTRASGDYEQLIVIARMRKARLQLELNFPGRIKNNFREKRYTELVECIAIKAILMELVKKAQLETAQTAAYWYKWRKDGFYALTGKVPNSVIDLDRISASPILPTVLRARNHFTPLGNVFRARAMVEFKRRFGTTGDKTGIDVTEDWIVDMTPGMGVPILLDPRVNNNTALMGLDDAHKAEYLELLHKAHYEFYLVQREQRLESLREDHNTRLQLARDLEQASLKLKAKAAEVAAVADQAAGSVDDTEKVTEDFCMGFEAESDDDQDAESPPSLESPPPSLPLISSYAHREQSIVQYKNYRKACRKLDWRKLFPDVPVKQGGPHCLSLWSVNMSGIFKELIALNVDVTPADTPDCGELTTFGYFIELALHSRYAISAPAASSFCERVNSHGKLVMNERSTQMKPRKVEERVMLRMNRHFMEHMRRHYPELTSAHMHLLLAANNALLDEPAE